MFRREWSTRIQFRIFISTLDSNKRARINFQRAQNARVSFERYFDHRNRFLRHPNVEINSQR